MFLFYAQRFVVSLYVLYLGKTKNMKQIYKKKHQLKEMYQPKVPLPHNKMKAGLRQECSRSGGGLSDLTPGAWVHGFICVIDYGFLKSERRLKGVGMKLVCELSCSPQDKPKSIKQAVDTNPNIQCHQRGQCIAFIVYVTHLHKKMGNPFYPNLFHNTS